MTNGSGIEVASSHRREQLALQDGREGLIGGVYNEYIPITSIAARYLNHYGTCCKSSGLVDTAVS